MMIVSEYCPLNELILIIFQQVIKAISTIMAMSFGHFK